MSRGGRRIGAGRKPKPKAADVLRHPSAPLPDSSAVVPPTTNGLSPVEAFDAPDDLSHEERQVWLKQAPHAFAARTLTRATAMAFERYCRVVTLERHEAQSSGVGGPNHRGLLRQIQVYELHFGLMPLGKPMAEPAKPVGATIDENEAYFA